MGAPMIALLVLVAMLAPAPADAASLADYLEGVTRNLETVRYTYAHDVAIALGARFKTAFGIGYVIYILISVGKSLITGEKEGIIKAIWTFPAMSIVSVLLIMPDLYYGYVIGLMEKFGLYTGGVILKVGVNLGRGLPPGDLFAGAPPTYGGLVRAMAESVGQLVDVAFEMMSSGGGFYIIVTAIAGILMLIPWALVAAIFCYLIIEALTQIAAVQALSPLLLGAAVFPAARSLWQMSLKMLLSAALSVAFACFAMGLTVGAVETHRADLVCNLVGFGTQACAKASEGLPTPPAPDSASDKDAAIAAGLPVGSARYAFTLILGFISVLLHLKAGSWASQLATAFDGMGSGAHNVQSSVQAAISKSVGGVLGAPVKVAELEKLRRGLMGGG